MPVKKLREVTVQRRAKLEGKWLRCTVPVSANGRLKGDAVVVNGNEISLKSYPNLVLGEFCLVYRTRDNGSTRKVFRPVGTSPIDAYNEAERQRDILEVRSTPIGKKRVVVWPRGNGGQPPSGSPFNCQRRE